MKKYFLLAASAFLMAATVITTSCSKDNDDATVTPDPGPGTTIVGAIQNLLNIENAELKEGNIPDATTQNRGITINTNSSALAGGGNILRILSPEPLKKLQISIEGVGGYLECVPQLVTAASARNAETSTADMYEYVVEVMYSMNLDTDIAINVNVVTENDEIISLLRQEAIDYVESQKGDLAINLVFDQPKDVDLHLVMPNGTHIFYGNPYVTVAQDDEAYNAFITSYYAKMEELAKKYGLNYEDGEVWAEDMQDHENYLAYVDELEAWYNANLPTVGEGSGLDHDSNAACDIDNLDNENIVLKAEYLVPGTYFVYINMYENCSDTSAETKWTAMVRLHDQLIKPLRGENPASGVFPIDAYSNEEDDISLMQIAMCFELTQEQIDAMKPANTVGKKPSYIFRAPLSDKAIMKLINGNCFNSKRFTPAVQRIK